MTGRRAGATAVAAVVATTLLVIVLGAWAASIGPSGVLTGTGPSPVGTPTITVQSSLDTGDRNIPYDDGHHTTPGWVRPFAILTNLLTAALAVWLLLRYVGKPLVSWDQARRRRRRAAAAEPDFVVREPAQAVAEEMLRDADEQRRELLEATTPRNAVVACWHRFESQAAAAGVERRAWETSSEYTMRVLDLVDAHQPAVSRLGALYREARFSEHELTEEHRQAALEALDTIHRTIGIPV